MYTRTLVCISTHTCTCTNTHLYVYQHPCIYTSTLLYVHQTNCVHQYTTLELHVAVRPYPEGSHLSRGTTFSGEGLRTRIRTLGNEPWFFVETTMADSKSTDLDWKMCAPGSPSKVGVKGTEGFTDDLHSRFGLMKGKTCVWKRWNHRLRKPRVESVSRGPRTNKPEDRAHEIVQDPKRPHSRQR